MKFAAQHYLTMHMRDSHSNSDKSCSICGKSFSGKRYLTMHIKANHESHACQKTVKPIISIAYSCQVNVSQ